MLHAALSLWLEFGLLTCCVQSNPSCQLAAGRPWVLPGLVWQVKRLPRKWTHDPKTAPSHSLQEQALLFPPSRSKQGPGDLGLGCLCPPLPCTRRWGSQPAK